MLFYRRRKYLFLFFTFIVYFYVQCTSAAPTTVSLELAEVNLAASIHLLAKFLNLNVIISPRVRGVVTLRLHNANPVGAFNLLLTAHGLGKWRIGNIWWIAPRDELIKQQQQELKWQDAYEAAAPLIMQFWQIKYSKAEDIAHVFQDERATLISKRGRIRVDVRTNTLCIQDVAERLALARELIRQLDVPVQQIAIEARLASIDNDFERELGFDFALKTQNSDGDNETTTKMLPPTPGRYSIAIAKLADGSLLDVKLAALENAGHAELISSPSLFTANQQPALIEAGEEIPYQEISDSGGTAVVFKKAVLGLKVTPQVLPGNKVLLSLQINQDRPNSKIVLGVPTISTRQIMTNVIARNGETIVLGGIYETNAETGEKRLPFISRIPVLGLLFKQQNTRQNKRELFIFVTPKIITQGP